MKEIRSRPLVEVLHGLAIASAWCCVDTGAPFLYGDHVHIALVPSARHWLMGDRIAVVPSAPFTSADVTVFVRERVRPTVIAGILAERRCRYAEVIAPHYDDADIAALRAMLPRVEMSLRFRPRNSALEYGAAVARVGPDWHGGINLGLLCRLERILDHRGFGGFCRFVRHGAHIHAAIADALFGYEGSSGNRPPGFIFGVEDVRPPSFVDRVIVVEDDPLWADQIMKGSGD